jgi:hypothetical protein
VPITLEQAKQLQYREVLVGEDGARWYVNGAVKLWVRDTNRIRVPLKHGLYRYSYIDGSDFTDGVCNWLTRESELVPI